MRVANWLSELIRDELPDGESEYCRAIGYEGLARFAWAGAGLYLVLLAVICVRLPSVPPFLIVQKALSVVILASLGRALSARRIPLRFFHAVSTGVLILCLISSACTAFAGLSSQYVLYAYLLVISCALVEISFRWAVIDWCLIALFTAWVHSQLKLAFSFDQLVMYIGFQGLAVPTMLVRLAMVAKQLRITQELAGALAESEKSRANLDKEVETRTHELKDAYESLRVTAKEREELQTQFLQSQKMESLGRLAGGVAHDFNNLLTVIQGNIQLSLLSSAEEGKALLHEASVAAKRAGEVTQQLLAFSRKAVLTSSDVNLQKLVSGSLKMIERLLGEDIALEADLRCPEGIVHGDPAQLHQVLLNLSVNALDAMPTGGKLKIELYADSGEVVLKMTDSGPGIAPEVRERIFEPFFTTKAAGKGTGLGLSTVHGIVCMHRGSITVESEPGKGACFVVRLPVRQGRTDDSSGRRLAPVVKGTGRLVLVEDDDQVRTLAMRSLTKAGYQVQPYDNGESALNGEELDVCDLLITDVVMPRMDGASLARAAMSRRPALPVLFMSGYTDDKLSAFDLDRDCRFLPKPFTPLQLQAAVAHILESERNAKQAQS